MNKQDITMDDMIEAIDQLTEGMDMAVGELSYRIDLCETLIARVNQLNY